MKIKIPLPVVRKVWRVAKTAIGEVIEAVDDDSAGGRRITRDEAIAIGAAVARAIEAEIVNAPVKVKR